VEGECSAKWAEGIQFQRANGGGSPATAATRSTEPGEAGEFQKRLLLYILAMDLMGFKVGGTKDPVPPLLPGEKKLLKSVLTKIS